jgi:hypothetical protein
LKFVLFYCMWIVDYPNYLHDHSPIDSHLLHMVYLQLHYSFIFLLIFPLLQLSKLSFSTSTFFTIAFCCFLVTFSSTMCLCTLIVRSQSLKFPLSLSSPFFLPSFPLSAVVPHLLNLYYLFPLLDNVHLDYIPNFEE